MTNTAKTGARRERLVRDHMLTGRWEFIMRAAASKGPADLAMAHPTHGLALVQCGSKSKTLGPADRARLLHAAHLCHALPILAVVIPRTPIRYWLVDAGTPSTWTEWTP
jgi:hypothetical protein